jgi:hypothetical protein
MSKDGLTLLDKAVMMGRKRPGRVGMLPRMPMDQLVDLALAWLHGTITTKAAATVLEIKHESNVRYTMASILKEAVMQGLVKIHKRPGG